MRILNYFPSAMTDTNYTYKEQVQGMHSKIFTAALISGSPVGIPRRYPKLNQPLHIPSSAQFYTAKN